MVSKLSENRIELGNMKKEFKSFPVRQLRASDKNWEAFKKKKNDSGKTWDKFIKDLLEKKKIRSIME